MTIIFGIIIFFLGTAIGSFLNVVIMRGSRNEKPGGRSYCESCRKQLKTGELIPIFSFLFQKGRCRQCQTILSWQYPLVELASGLAFLITFALLPINTLSLYSFLKLAAIWLVFSAVIVIFVSDLRYKIIPDGAVALLLAFGVAKTLSGSNLKDIVPNIVSVILLTSFLGALWFFSDGAWMGFGDVKLISATSLILGYPASLSAFIFSFWLGGIAGVLLLVAKKKGLKSQLPFGPFIILGSILAHFYSQAFLYKVGLIYFL